MESIEKQDDGKITRAKKKGKKTSAARPYFGIGGNGRFGGGPGHGGIWAGPL